MCGSMVDIQSLIAEIRQGKKEEKKKKRNHSMKIYMACPITYGGHKTVHIVSMLSMELN